MKSKAELKAKCDELDQHLKLIYKYQPALKDLEDNVQVLQRLGLNDKQIADVISRGATTVTSTITNPLTGEEMAIYVEDVSVQKDKTGQYEVFVGGVHYMDFFSNALLSKDKLEMLAQANPEVKVLYQENQQLKRLLTMLGKKA